MVLSILKDSGYNGERLDEDQETKIQDFVSHRKSVGNFGIVALSVF